MYFTSRFLPLSSFPEEKVFLAADFSFFYLFAVCFSGISRMKKTLKLSNFNHQSDESTTISYFSLVKWQKSFTSNNFLISLFLAFQYRFATSWDWLLIFVGVFGSFLKAIPSIWTTIAYGELTALLIDRTDGTDPGPSIVLLRWFGGGEILR